MAGEADKSHEAQTHLKWTLGSFCCESSIHAKCPFSSRHPLSRRDHQINLRWSGLIATTTKQVPVCALFEPAEEEQRDTHPTPPSIIFARPSAASLKWV